MRCYDFEFNTSIDGLPLVTVHFSETLSAVMYVASMKHTYDANKKNLVTLIGYLGDPNDIVCIDFDFAKNRGECWMSDTVKTKHTKMYDLKLKGVYKQWT